MAAIARFERVSLARFTADRRDWMQGESTALYQAISLPRRATAGSAGYDFFLPDDLTLRPGESVLVPTGIRALMEPGWVLMLYPRSGLGVRHRLGLDNTTGVIDADYALAENEGHILVSLHYGRADGPVLHLEKGKAFVQGVFLPFGLVEGDAACELRRGGFGSTQ